MEIQIANFNGVRPDDIERIIGYNRMLLNTIFIEDVPMAIYLIRLKYKDGVTKDIRVYCETETRKALKTEQEVDEFFFKRLFGTNGLIVKQKRNDYIFLGGINQDKTSKFRFSRANKTNGKKENQQLIEEHLQKNVYPSLTFGRATIEDFDLFNMKFYFHTGNEEKNQVFSTGLRSQYGNKSFLGFAQLGSTFCEFKSELNNLYDSAKEYGTATNNKGHHVFILRIPIIYRRKFMKTGELYPPLPTHKLLDAKTGDSYIIPELIYGMYDMDTGILHTNPNYNPKYDPNGLIYDEETAKEFIYDDDQF